MFASELINELVQAVASNGDHEVRMSVLGVGTFPVAEVSKAGWTVWLRSYTSEPDA